MTAKLHTRILICEDNEPLAHTMTEILRDVGYSVFSLVKDHDHDYIVDNIEAKVKRLSPNIAIIAGLYGKCWEVRDLAVKAKPSIVPVIYSGNKDLVNTALARGIYALNKSKDCRGLYEFLKYIPNKSKI